MPVISRIWARSALISAGLQPQQENWNPGDWSAQLAYSSRSAARDGRPTPRLQGNLSRRSRSYGHSMGVNTPARKSALMATPWVVALAVEYAVFRRFFATDLRQPAAPAAAGGPEVDDTEPRLPVYPVVVLVLTLAGFGAASFVHLDPAVVAAIGVVALAVPAVRGRRATPGSLLSAAAVPFLAFVVGLAVVVRAVQDAGLSADFRAGVLTPIE